MDALYAYLISKKMKTWAQVPEHLQAGVKEILEAQGLGHLAA